MELFFLIDYDTLFYALSIVMYMFCLLLPGNNSKLRLEDIVDLKNQECAKIVMLNGEFILLCFYITI